jgi:hypothetical protein
MPREAPRGAVFRSSRSTLIAGAILACGVQAHAAPESNEPPCAVTDVQYALSASLAITNTTMGAGNGVHRIGPGRVVIRFDGRSGHRRASLLAYDLRQSFTVVSSVLFWATTVKTNVQVTTSTRAPDSVADGTLEDLTVRWDGRARGVRSDGSIECEGWMCGKFGAPPSGMSELHVAPTSMALEPFGFSADMKTFTMPYAVVSESEAPRHRTLVSISGREVQRACVAPPSS